MKDCKSVLNSVATAVLYAKTDRLLLSYYAALVFIFFVLLGFQLSIEKLLGAVCLIEFLVQSIAILFLTTYLSKVFVAKHSLGRSGLIKMILGLTFLYILGCFMFMILMFSQDEFFDNKLLLWVFGIVGISLIRNLGFAVFICREEEGQKVKWYNVFSTWFLISNTLIGAWAIHPRIKTLWRQASRTPSSY